MSLTPSHTATATMTSVPRFPDIDDGPKASRNTNGTVQANGGIGSHPPPSASARRDPGKYRHIAAVHREPRTSCLSHDSEASPSFLGFRNLMVLVLSGYSPNFKAWVSIFCVRNRAEADKGFLSSCYESTTCGGELYEGMASLPCVASRPPCVSTRLTSALVRSIDLHPMS